MMPSYLFLVDGAVHLQTDIKFDHSFGTGFSCCANLLKASNLCKPMLV